MKVINSILVATMLLGSASLFTSCDDDNVNPNPDPNSEIVWGKEGSLKTVNKINPTEEFVLGNGDQELVFTGKQKLKKGTYTMKGWIYIKDGAELTLEPGTVIKGDKNTKAALIVERGGKLYAKGTAEAPIVFTSAQAPGSRKPGDWGGVILCGKASNNNGEQAIEGGPRTKHGGSDNADSSGALSYVRIEFAGYPFQKDQEINGLTLGSVGSGTQLDHIQVSFSNDDSYEWFGGTVNAKYLVAYSGWDDDFDTDNGFSGKVQYALSIRNSRLADTSQSNSFESDNNSSGSEASPRTSAVFSNVTFVGPMVDPNFKNDASYINGGAFNPNNGSALGRFQSAMHLRRNTQLNCFNSLIIGWPVGVIIDNEKGDAQGNASKGLLALNNIFMANVNSVGSDANKVYDDVKVTGYESKKPVFDKSQPSFSSSFFKSQKGNRVEANASAFNLGMDNISKVNIIPSAGSPLLNTADFTHSKLSSGFDKVNYVGAFDGQNNWLNGWTNFDPQNTKY